jgi:hypothetical protein
MAAVPNPQKGPVFSLDVKLAAPMDVLAIQVFDKAMVLVSSVQLNGGLQAGWNLINIDLPGLGNAIYFVRARGKQGGCPTVASNIEKLYIIR